MKVVSWDIESGSVDDLHSAEYRYVRLCGWQTIDMTTGETGPVQISDDPQELIRVLMDADANTAHNGAEFDAQALAWWEGADYERLVTRMWDTQIVERQLNPVAAKGRQRTGYYGLDATAERYGAPGKTDDIKALARKHGGYHLIPQDDAEYRAYLTGDVRAQTGLFLAQREAVLKLPPADLAYIRREHAVAAITGRISLEGFRVNMDLTMKRYAEGQARLEAGKRFMHQYGMPLEGKKPHVTNLGKAAFRRAIIGTGISELALNDNWPVNKDGSLSTKKEVLQGMVAAFEGRNDVAANLCRTVLQLNGERTVAATVLAHTVNGRAHARISPRQSSGRWSVTEPGMTVLKKSERGMFRADEGYVLAAIDADQADMRVLAAASQEPGLISIINDPEQDLHSAVAYAVFRNPDCLEEMKRNHGRCECPLRHTAKTCGIGTAYGLGVRQLAIQGGVTEDAAREFQQGFFGSFTALAQYTARIREEAGAMGYGETAPEDDSYRILRNFAGRTVRVERDRAYTQAVATVTQSGTRDVMARAALALPPDVRRGLKVLVHDEFVLQLLDTPDVQERAQAIAESMAFDLNGVRITFGCSKVAKSWDGCYK